MLKGEELKLGYRINFENFNNTFTVPKSLVEKNIKIASGEQVKVLLAFLSFGGNCSVEDVSAATGSSVYDCTCALDFWTERGLILSDEIEITNQISQKEIEKRFDNVKEIARPQFSDVLIRSKEDSNFAELLQRAQMILGRTISSTEQEWLLYYVDTYGLPCEVIITMLGYLKSIDDYSFRYINKVALDWAEKEINTLSKAEEHIDKLLYKRKREYRIRKILDIGSRKLTKKESSLFERWTIEMGLPDELLEFGYDVTVDHAGKLSMAYLDKVLTSIYQNGVKTVEEAEKLDFSFKKRKAAKKAKETSYNIEEVDNNLFKN